MSYTDVDNYTQVYVHRYRYIGIGRLTCIYGDIEEQIEIYRYRQMTNRDKNKEIGRDREIGVDGQIDGYRSIDRDRRRVGDKQIKK